MECVQTGCMVGGVTSLHLGIAHNGDYGDWVEKQPVVFRVIFDRCIIGLASGTYLSTNFNCMEAGLRD